MMILRELGIQLNFLLSLIKVRFSHTTIDRNSLKFGLQLVCSCLTGIQSSGSQQILS